MLRCARTPLCGDADSFCAQTLLHLDDPLSRLRALRPNLHEQDAGARAPRVARRCTPRTRRPRRNKRKGPFALPPPPASALDAMGHEILDSSVSISIGSHRRRAPIDAGDGPCCRPPGWGACPHASFRDRFQEPEPPASRNSPALSRRHGATDERGPPTAPRIGRESVTIPARIASETSALGERALYPGLHRADPCGRAPSRLPRKRRLCPKRGQGGRTGVDPMTSGIPLDPLRMPVLGSASASGSCCFQRRTSERATHGATSPRGGPVGARFS